MLLMKNNGYLLHARTGGLSAADDRNAMLVGRGREVGMVSHLVRASKGYPFNHIRIEPHICQRL